jgi:hypothetical protein
LGKALVVTGTKKAVCLILLSVMNGIDRVRVKIVRAIEHQRGLVEAVRAFLSSSPYRVSTKTDPATRRLIYYVESVQDTPVEISSIIGDILQNLRSALDHLAFELFMVGTLGKAGAGRHVCFPIFDDANGYNSNAAGRLKGVSANVIAAIDATKPYRGGNDVLWRIHRLNNIDKHRFLVTVGSAFRSLDLGAHMQQKMSELKPELAKIEFPPLFFKPADKMFPLKPGDELFLDAPDAKPNPKMQFRFEIALGENGVIEGEPLIETLQSMIGTVDNLVRGFANFLN